MPGLEVILLTDGDIWNQELLFRYINSQVTDSGGKIRVFPLGIGSSVSSSLINGLARAGSGYAHHVANDERIDRAVARMLKCSLTPHVTDYTLEIKYEDNDYEIIEKVADGVKNVVLSPENEASQHLRRGRPKYPFSIKMLPWTGMTHPLNLKRRRAIFQLLHSPSSFKHRTKSQVCFPANVPSSIS